MIGGLLTIAGGRRRRRDVRPDVLGQDRHAGLLEVGLGCRADDPHRRGVERRHRLDAGRVVGEVGHVVLDDERVGEGHVGGRQGLPVLPPDIRPQVDRPDLAVGRDAAVLLGRELRGQVERRLVVVAAAEELRVVQGPDLVSVVRVADERVQAVGLGRPAEAQDDLGGGRGAAARGQRPGQAPDEAAAQNGDHAEDGQGSTRRDPTWCVHGAPRVGRRQPTAKQHHPTQKQGLSQRRGQSTRASPRASRAARRASPDPGEAHGHETRQGCDAVNGGGGGIRTLEGPCDPWRFSRPLHSAALPPLRAPAADRPGRRVERTGNLTSCARRGCERRGGRPGRKCAA